MKMWRYLVLAVLVASCRGLPQGAPPSVCQSMKPIHGGGIEAQTDPSPFLVAPASRQVEQGSTLQVTLGSRQGVQFGGFMLHARSVDNGEPLGAFTQVPTDTSKAMQCSAPNDTVTHANAQKKGPIDFQWTAPADFLGDVVFKATVAQDYGTFWVGFDSPVVRVVRQGEITPEQSTTSQNLRPTTTPPYFTTQSQGHSTQQEDSFYRDCSTSKSCFGAPEGCVETRDCKAVVGITVRGDRYLFEVQAPRGAKYVAVALSDDNKMGDDSVIECVREGNGAKAYMSVTTPRPKLGVERLQRPTLGIEMINYNITDGMLYCNIRRDVKTNVNGRVYDLVNDKYVLLIAAGTKLKGIAAGYHDIAYLPAAEKRYLSDVSAVSGASKLLLRLHGAFMLTAWVGTASVGILLARYYRQTWVSSQMCGKDQWFAWHRIFMIATWSLTMAGFVLIFVELGAWSSEQNPHAILGLVTTILCFLQPIGAFFRPHPGTPRRPLFNWLHWLGGNVAHILAIVTIFFAVKLSKAELPEWMDWILVAFVAFHVCMHLILSLYWWLQILGCAADRASERRVSSFQMKDLANPHSRNSHLSDRKADAPNSGVRKTLLGIYIFVIILLVAALVVVAVLAPFEETWKNIKRNVMP